MLIELNRMMTADEVRREYRIPEGLFKKLLPELPVAYRDESEQPFYLESEIDKFLHRYLARPDDQDRLIPPDRVRLDKKEYKFGSGIEWRLLECLLGANDRAVKFQDAVEYVYGENADYKDDALRQLVKNLNKKMTDQGCPFSIRVKNGYVCMNL